MAILSVFFSIFDHSALPSLLLLSAVDFNHQPIWIAPMPINLISMRKSVSKQPVMGKLFSDLILSWMFSQIHSSFLMFLTNFFCPILCLILIYWYTQSLIHTFFSHNYYTISMLVTQMDLVFTKVSVAISFSLYFHVSHMNGFGDHQSFSGYKPDFKDTEGSTSVFFSIDEKVGRFDIWCNKILLKTF